MVVKAQDNDKIIGLIPDIIPKDVAILQYADDIICCLENNIEKARNLKLLLSLSLPLSLYIYISRCQG
jgi:hypothetical protein